MQPFQRPKYEETPRPETRGEIGRTVTLELPPPVNDSEVSLFSALEKRRTIREMAREPLSKQMLSNLLWAACGVNRRSGPFGVPGRTAASASNSQEVGLYVALPEGAYLYDAYKNSLVLVTTGAIRQEALTAGQGGVGAKAPVQLIYVADRHKLTHTAGFEEPNLHDPEVQKAYYFVDTGLIAGNVYLFAAANGLAAWFHNCDKPEIAKVLRLRQEQNALFAQSVGYPAKTSPSSAAKHPSVT